MESFHRGDNVGVLIFIVIIVIIVIVWNGDYNNYNNYSQNMYTNERETNGASRRKAHKNESKKYNLTEQRLEHISKESRSPMPPQPTSFPLSSPCPQTTPQYRVCSL